MSAARVVEPRSPGLETRQLDAGHGPRPSNGPPTRPPEDAMLRGAADVPEWPAAAGSSSPLYDASAANFHTAESFWFSWPAPELRFRVSDVVRRSPAAIAPYRGVRFAVCLAEQGHRLFAVLSSRGSPGSWPARK